MRWQGGRRGGNIEDRRGLGAAGVGGIGVGGVILAAIGYAGVTDLDVGRIRLFLGDVLVAEHGGRAANYREEDGARIMAAAEIAVTVELNRGHHDTTVWTCDFSYDYVKINADYRS